jgi:hypothetical protein
VFAEKIKPQKKFYHEQKNKRRKTTEVHGEKNTEVWTSPEKVDSKLSP